MSSSAPIEGVAEVLIRSVVNDKPVEMCLWFHCWTGPITTTNLMTIASRVRILWSSNFRGVLASGVLFKEVVATDRSSSSVGSATIIVNSIGGFGGEAAPGNIALGVVNEHPAVQFRSVSRSYIYAIPEAKVTDGVIESAYASGLLGLWATNNQSHSPFGWHHVAVSLYSNGVARPAGLWERVTNYSLARLNPAAQRRRLKGR